jgi:methionyl-tRNA formyltransferase
MKVLYLTRKNIKYQKNIHKILKKKFSNINVVYSKKTGETLSKKFNVSYDYVFSYRSYIILKKDFLKKVKFSAINFHPAPPKLRGFAPASFAIIKKLKKFGSTIHIMNDKIDNGRILDVKLFSINENINIKKLLKLTYQNQYEQIKIFLDKYDSIINSKNNYKWSKKIYYKKNIDDLMEIKNSYSKEKINLIIKATKIGKYKPFKLKNNKKKIY